MSPTQNIRGDPEGISGQWLPLGVPCETTQGFPRVWFPKLRDLYVCGTSARAGSSARNGSRAPRGGLEADAQPAGLARQDSALGVPRISPPSPSAGRGRGPDGIRDRDEHLNDRCADCVGGESSRSPRWIPSIRRTGSPLQGRSHPLMGRFLPDRPPPGRCQEHVRRQSEAIAMLCFKQSDSPCPLQF